MLITGIALIQITSFWLFDSVSKLLFRVRHLPSQDNELRMGAVSLLLNLLITSVLNDVCVCSNDFIGFLRYRTVIHSVPGCEAF